MTDTYRLVLLDTEGHEVGHVRTISFNPNDVLVIMPESGALFPQKMCEMIAQSLEGLHIKGIVFHVPVQLARLERIND